jgi:hypothetical protein
MEIFALSAHASVDSDLSEMLLAGNFLRPEFSRVHNILSVIALEL